MHKKKVGKWRKRKRKNEAFAVTIERLRLHNIPATSSPWAVTLSWLDGYKLGKLGQTDIVFAL